MIEQALAITFTVPSDLDNPYWLRMALVDEPDSTMTVGEAAGMIDALFATSACDGSADNQPRENPTAADWDRAFGRVDLRQCNDLDNVDDPGAYDTKIKVYRSHQHELYKLLFSHGTATGPRRTYENVELTLAIEDADNALLDIPVESGFRAAWTDNPDGPEIKRNGNLLYWDGRQTGVIRAEFQTVYDIWSVHVTGINDTTQVPADGSSADDEQKWLGTGWYSGSEDGSELTSLGNTECAVLAFYHYQFDELVLDKPEQDESVTDAQWQAVCYRDGATIVNPDDPGTPDDWTVEKCKAACRDRYHDDRLQACLDSCERDCVKRIAYDTVCDCGGDEDTAVEEVPVQCPPGYNTGSVVGQTEDGGTKFIDCGTDTVHDPAYYQEKCCPTWPFDADLPKCVELHGVFVGDGPTDEQIAAIKQHYGQDANIIPVGPSGPNCGEVVTRQEVNAANCCDDVQAPQIGDDVAVVAPGSLVTVTASAGLPPCRWHASHGLTIEESGDSWVRIRAAEDFCGSSWVSVTDVCGRSDKKYIRSTDGQWVSLGNVCVLDGVADTYYGHSGTSFYASLTDGRYRQTVHMQVRNTENNQPGYYSGEAYLIPNPSYSPPAGKTACESGCGVDAYGLCGCFQAGIDDGAVPDGCLTMEVNAGLNYEADVENYCQLVGIHRSWTQEWGTTSRGWNCVDNEGSPVSGASTHWRVSRWYETTYISAEEWVC